MLRCFFPCAAILLSFLFPGISNAHAKRIQVKFTGEITQSTYHEVISSPFADFTVGSTFQGSFVFDSDLIDRMDSLSVTAGTFDRFFGAITDYRVDFELPGRVYSYRPPTVGTGHFEGRTLSQWNIGNNYSIQPNPEPSSLRDLLHMRVLNYPGQWSNGPTGVPYGHVLPDQYVEGWYPHSSFFSLLDYIEPFDALVPANQFADVNRAYEHSDSRRFHIRFTDPNDPSWSQGRESNKATVHGVITSLVVVPEPSSLAIALLGSTAYIGCRRR